MTAKKAIPSLKDFPLSCGQCQFCHPIPEHKTLTGCYVSQPIFSHWDEEDPIYIDCVPIKVTRPACGKFKPTGDN